MARYERKGCRRSMSQGHLPIPIESVEKIMKIYINDNEDVLRYILSTLCPLPIESSAVVIQNLQVNFER